MGDEVDYEWQTVKRRYNKGLKKNIDIATAQGKNGAANVTTYFFTDFPNSFGAKAMLNAFHYYGDIVEVVIPAKRDKRGNRFGFARFNNVTDVRGFESELANLTIGRDKISVNLSRYNRFEGSRRHDDQRVDKFKERGDHHNVGERKGEGQRSVPEQVQQQPLQFKEAKRSYAQIVRKDYNENQGEEEHRIVLSYEAEKDDLLHYQKSFVGLVAQPGMSYNIQEAFHREGYFGVKITPLGSNLTLLEGQEEGEVEALMEDAKEWLEQWFTEIRPWSPDDVDLERSIWLRIFGVPIHAWNLNFFTQVVKPWGTFIKADDGTMKKTTMDVARIMIRTSCQLVVDEFIDVKINGKIFHLRILEDSYGPMRIMVPQNNNSNGRDNEVESDEEEEDEEEEEHGRLIMEEVEQVQERESAGEKNDLAALTPIVNSINGNNKFSISVLARNNTVSNCSASNSNPLKLGGGGSEKINNNEVDSKIVEKDFCLGQEEGLDGPQNSANTILSITGGVDSDRLGQQFEVGPQLSVDSHYSTKSSNGDKRKQKGGVYSDGPRLVYNKLNQIGPTNLAVSCPILQPQEISDTVRKRIHPIPANVRRQNHIIHKLNLGKSIHSFSTPDDCSFSKGSEAPISCSIQ
jgi:hypothetical protein